jgi:hypothetical protein
MQTGYKKENRPGTGAGGFWKFHELRLLPKGEININGNGRKRKVTYTRRTW